jgi:hypothetical protein
LPNLPVEQDQFAVDGDRGSELSGLNLLFEVGEKAVVIEGNWEDGKSVTIRFCRLKIVFY